MQRDLLQQIDREDVEKHYRKTYQTGSKALFFAQDIDQQETWVPLIEKAYAKAHGDYASISGGYIGEGMEDLSGGVMTEVFTSDILDLDDFWENEMMKVNQEFLFGCSTGLMEHGTGSRDGISEGHAYVVMEARTMESGQRLVKLRNPWGKIRKGLWDGPWSDGSKEWTMEAQQELGHKFGSDSVFWIPFEDMIQKYTLMDRTRLFRDPDWRCCQRWIGVDVPWKPDWHEKFQIKLTKDSALVLVLSQLDNRYFKGLHGQYRFRLHFRLHYKDRPEAEDYIVRSHGNYLTRRSVSVELPDMPAGEYTVYLKVTGERDTDLSSVEDVVKRECKERSENQKLAQVGYAYDLAHSKAWDHMNKVAKIRKRMEQKKATTNRQKERRRNWEKRHLNREASKQQTKKNKEKKERRREAWDKEQQKDADDELSDQEQPRAEDEAKAPEVAGDVVRAAQGAETAVTAAQEVPKKSSDGENDDKLGSKDQNQTDADKDEVSEEIADKSFDGTNVSVSTGSPQFTPKTEDSSIVQTDEKKEDVPPISGPPPPVTSPTPAKQSKPAKAARVVPEFDEAESSDSPVEDWEELYSSDDMTRKPRTQPLAPPQPRDEYDTEEEKMPDPWNAICVVGIRVYSKDGDLELRTVIEGGELLEGGMGEKGAADLDDAQANAGGFRDRNSEPMGSNSYPHVIRSDGQLLTPGVSKADIQDYIRYSSVNSSGMNTPAMTSR